MLLLFPSFGNIHHVARKKFLLIILLLASAFCVHADSILATYDFTFYKTVSESLQIANKEKIGFDYTGFGFLGSNRTTGLFMRIGLQAPYKSLIGIVKPETVSYEIEENGSTSIVKASEKTTELTLSFILGGAKRFAFDEKLDFYLGYGFLVNMNIFNKTNISNIMDIKSFQTKLAFDFDAGAKFLMRGKHSLRIGVYESYSLFSLTSFTMTFRDQNISPFTYFESEFTFLRDNNFFILPIKYVGYISMGITFSSNSYRKLYRYTITDRDANGILEELNQ